MWLLERAAAVRQQMEDHPGQDVGNTAPSNNQTGNNGQSGGNSGSLSEGLGFDTGSVGLVAEKDRTEGLK